MMARGRTVVVGTVAVVTEGSEGVQRASAGFAATGRSRMNRLCRVRRRMQSHRGRCHRASVGAEY